MSIYFHDYFSKDGYPVRSRFAFGAPLVEALEYAESRLGKDETLYIMKSVYPRETDKQFKPYKYATLLFFIKIPPAVYQSGGIPSNRITLYDGGDIENPGILITNVAFSSRNMKFVCPPRLEIHRVKSSKPDDFDIGRFYDFNVALKTLFNMIGNVDAGLFAGGDHIQGFQHRCTHS